MAAVVGWMYHDGGERRSQIRDDVLSSCPTGADTKLDIFFQMIRTFDGFGRAISISWGPGLRVPVYEP